MTSKAVLHRFLQKVLLSLILGGILLPVLGWAAGPPPTINVHPVSQSVLLNDSVTFFVGASSATTLSYQWLKNGANISGATLSNYTIVSVQTNDQATYAVRVVNSGGTVTSSNAILTVLVPPVITTQPQSQTVNRGTNASFSVAAIGASPIIYRWSFNGSPLPGATNSSLTLTNVQISDGGGYQVVMTNVYGSATSSVATLGVFAGVMPVAVAGTEDVPLIFSAANGNRISVSPPDSGTPYEVTLWVNNGTMTLNGTTALTFTSGDGVADASMTFRGLLLYLNQALNGLTFYPAANFNGSTTLALQAVNEKLVAVNYDANLVGRYTFDAPSSAVTLGKNSSPAGGNNGTISGATAAVDGTRGNVLSFDGSGNGDEVRINGRFGNPANVTLAAWVNLTVAATNGSEVISLGDSTSLRLDDAGKLKGFIFNGLSWKEITYTTTLQGAGWHHVAYTFSDTANLQKLYLDGVMVASRSEGGSISYILGANSYIGVHGDGGNTHNFTGLIDEARIYARALNDNEIATLATDLSFYTANSTTITLAPVNDLPVTVANAFTTPEDTTLGVSAPGILANDVEVDGDAFTAVLVSNVTRGALALSANGSFTYTPSNNFNGSDSFSYASTDGLTTGNVAIVTINVTPVNDAPIAFNQSLTTAEDTALAITLTSFDVEGPVTNFTIVTLPANGTLTGSGASRSYLPNTNYFGSDSFTFRVNDGSLTSAVVTVSLTITPVNEAPVANNDSTLVYENFYVTIPVLSNDTDLDGDPLAIVGTATTNGTAVISGTNVVFTPATNFVGTVVFSYTVSDGTASASANVTVTVLDTTNHFLLQAWTTNYSGSAANSSDSLQAVALDAQGNVYVTGYAKEAASASYDYVTLKYSPAGTLLWRAVYEAGFGRDDLASALALDSAGNVYVTGTSPNAGNVADYATVKYDGNGNQLWVARYDGGLNKADIATGVAVDTNGNVFVTGYSINALSKNQYVTIKYNSAGQGAWTNTYVGPGLAGDLAKAIALDPAGNVYVTGQSQGTGSSYDYATVKYSNAGIQLWVARYNGPGNDDDIAVAMVVDAAANIYVTGSSINAAGNSDYATVKYNTSGAQLWAARYAGPGGKDDFATRLVLDSAGNVFVTGTSSGPNNTSDYATLKYNPLGQQQWVQRYDAGDDDTAAALALDPSGDVYVTGSSKITGFDFATIKYLSADGSLQGVARFNSGGALNDTAIGIAIDSQYNVYVAGQGYSPLDYVLVKYVPTYRAAFAPPLAVNDITNANKNFNVTIPVMANDTQPGGGAMWIIRTATTNGTAVISGTNVVFTPDTNFVGTVVFSYTISDSTNTTVAAVTVNVLETLLSFGQPWATNYNGSVGNANDYLTATALDAQGNVIVTGYAKEAASASYDYVTLKYSPTGTLLWRVVYEAGFGKDDQALALTLDSAGNVYVTGNSGNVGGVADYATIKYNSNGNQLWVARYDGGLLRSDLATSVAVDTNGNVFVTGSSINAINKSQYVTVKYNSAGQGIWTNIYVGPGFAGDLANAVALDPAGNVYVTGQSQGTSSGYDYATVKYSNSGLQLWVTRYNGTGNGDDNAVAMVVDAAGNIHVTGSSINLAGKTGYATVKYDTSGAQLWVARYDGAVGRDSFATDIVLDGAGNVFVTGSSAVGPGTWDYGTIKYNSLGQQHWVQRYDAGDDDQGAALALDPSGDVYVTGKSKSATGYDFATIKYLSLDGSQQGVARFNSVGTVNDTAVGIAIDSQYNVYIGGQGYNPLDYVLVKNQPLLNPPIVSAPAVSQVTTNSALFAANVNPQGAPTTCYFQYGVTTNYGLFSATNALGSGNDIVAVAAPITGLAPGALYHCRVVAINTAGITFGEDSSFTTSGTSVGPPAIFNQPQSLTTPAGQDAAFSVSVNGANPLNYQWKCNGTTLPGATGATLALTNVQTNHVGNYVVVISNFAGSVTSAVATLTVLIPPVITTGPQSQTVSPGQNVTLGVVANGSGPLGYQWKFNDALVFGATYSTLQLTNVRAADSGRYSVVVFNGAGSATNAAILTVTNPPCVLSISNSTGNAGFAIELSAPIGSTYVIQASTNLVDWAPIYTNVALTATVIFTDSSSTNYSMRFYRAMMQSQ